MMALPEQFTAIGKAQMEAALRFAVVATKGVEQLAELNLKAARSAFDDGLKSAKSLSEIKDVAELPGWTASLAQPGFEKASAYAKSVYEVSTSTGSELGALLEEEIAEFNKQFVTALDAALKSAPAGSESAVAAVKSVMGIANTAYDNLTKANKQLAAMTEANMAAAATQTGGPAKKKAA
ncbi:MAG TPA: phasin family protein [Burkholderiales bacterium]|nr:phasin family protein [Burkholderiales bacterium]